jgi:hypothetical protein
MDFSIDVFYCVAVNSKQIFASLWKGDRAVVMADPGSAFEWLLLILQNWEKESRAPGGRARVGSGRRARERLRPFQGRFSHNGVFFFSSLIS